MMMVNKYIFTGLVVIILSVFIFMGYVYYSSRHEGQDSHKATISSYPISNNQIIKTQEPLSYTDAAIVPAIIKTMATKQDYQPIETEQLFYQKVIESFKPKQFPEGQDDSKTQCYKTFPPRASYPTQTIEILQFITKRYTEPLSNDLLESKKELQELLERYNKAVSDSRQYYQDIIMNLQELTKQCPDSPYYPHYQETFNIVMQMQKEDEEFYDKYSINAYDRVTGRNVPDVYYRDAYAVNFRPVPLDERINAYIYCLRYSYFYKSNGRYAIDFGDADKEFLGYYKGAILSGEKLIKIGAEPVAVLDKLEDGRPIIRIDYPKIPTQNVASAVLALLNILEDRRPIIVADDTKMPAVFYRYQDAAIEILQRMFNKDKQPFSVEIPQDQYFSEYLEQQTPEMKQKIINDIKVWVEESMKNTPETQQPPESPK